MKNIFATMVLTANFLISSSSLSWADGLDQCLQAYQNKVQQHHNKIQQKNDKKAQIKDLPSVKEKDLPHMWGPCHFYNKENGDLGGVYLAGSFITLGALPLAHWALKGAYRTATNGAAAAANILVVRPTNLGIKAYKAKSKAKANPHLYEREMTLINELKRYNAEEILFSDIFQKVLKVPSIKERYNDHRDVYTILKMAFEKEIPCRDKENPASYEKIVQYLGSGQLSQITGYNVSGNELEESK